MAIYLSTSPTSQRRPRSSNSLLGNRRSFPIPRFISPPDSTPSSRRRNPTYFVTDAKGSRYVLRKKPMGKLVSKTAHAIEREFKVIDAVGKTGRIPVPKVYALYVFALPFFLQESGLTFCDFCGVGVRIRKYWELHSTSWNTSKEGSSPTFECRRLNPRPNESNGQFFLLPNLSSAFLNGSGELWLMKRW